MSSKKKRIRFRFLRTIRARLFLGYSGLLLVSMAVVAAYFYMQMSRNLLEISKKYLRDEIDTMASLVSIRSLDRGSFVSFLSGQTATGKGQHRIDYALFDGEGLLIAGSKNFTEDQNSINSAAGSAGIYEKIVKNASGRKTLLGTKKFRDHGGGEYFLQLSIEPLSESGMLKTVLLTFLAVTPAVFIVLALGAFYFTGRSLKPVSRLAWEVKKLSLLDTDRALPLSGSGDELDQLASAFNEVYRKLSVSYRKIVNFTADVSHEMRIPLTAIKGEAEVVLERARGEKEYQDTLASIIEEHDKLISMLNRLLLLARGDSGEALRPQSRINLVEIVRRMTDFYRPLAETRELSIDFSSAEDNIQVMGDPDRLQGLFSNLIENAVKYNKRNGEIHVQLSRSGRECAVTVSDTGIGIPAQELNKIFERFYRVDKSRSRSAGSAGLGLSIAEMIAKEHQGTIKVESSPGRGSSFTVILPLSMQ